MFYNSFKQFIDLQHALNMDDNIGKGCGFEDFSRNKAQSQVRFLSAQDIKNIAKRNIVTAHSSRWNKSKLLSKSTNKGVSDATMMKLKSDDPSNPKRDSSKLNPGEIIKLKNSKSEKGIKFMYNRNVYNYGDMEDNLIRKVPLIDLFTHDKEYLMRANQK